MSELAAWDRFVDLLTDDPRVAPEVRLALTDADAYLERHAEQLADRGIDEAGDVEAVLALVDSLAAVGDLAYVDWKEPSEYLLEMVGALPRVRATGIAIEGVLHHDDVGPVVAAANRLLAPAGVVVVVVEEGTDGCPLVALPVDRHAAVVAAGEAVDVWVREPD